MALKGQCLVCELVVCGAVWLAAIYVHKYTARQLSAALH